MEEYLNNIPNWVWITAVLAGVFYKHIGPFFEKIFGQLFNVNTSKLKWTQEASEKQVHDCRKKIEELTKIINEERAARKKEVDEERRERQKEVEEERRQRQKIEKRLYKMMGFADGIRDMFERHGLDTSALDRYIEDDD